MRILLLSLLLAAPARAALPTLTLTEVTAEAQRAAAHPCTTTLLRRTGAFSEAQAACAAMWISAVVSLQTPNTKPDAASVAAVRALVAQALEPAAQAPFASTGTSAVAGRALPRSVLYRGLLLLSLAGLEKLAPDSEHTPLFDALARALAGDLAQGLLPSYGADRIWPCDHAPAASALALHGRLRGDATTAAAGAALVQKLEALRVQKGGFATRTDRRGAAIEATPRGVAMAWTAAFLLPGAPDAARRFAQTFTEQFCDRAPHGVQGLVACREWPRGVARAADGASGPIIQGYGTGASALGIGATHALDDATWARGLVGAATAMGVEQVLKDSGGLERALWAWANTLAPW